MARDCLQRYLFEGVSVRGELVQLSDAFQALTANKDYPKVVKTLLGELMAATSLLTATLKFAGNITVQIQGDGPISLLVINGNHQQQMRGTARWDEQKIPNEANLNELIGKGQMVITIEPEKGERYQGIVGLGADTLQGCLEEYFSLSEQLDTRLWLRTGIYEGKAVAAGMLLQVLPGEAGSDDNFTHLVQLTETVKDEELFGLPAEEVLYRLYHQETVNIFEPSTVSFKCSCSREKCASAIIAIDKKEVDEILEESGSIQMHCDYCGTDYVFDSVDVVALFDGSHPASSSIH